jgi:RNA polymerase sigma factor (TIGR02999 family)
MSAVTQLLIAAQRGERPAAEQLLPLVYDELRRLAAARLAEERPGQTLQATALVHEAYLRLVGDQRFDGRGHFFAAAAEAMRRILVENARRKHAAKRGAGGRRVELEPGLLVGEGPSLDLLALDEALARLEKDSPARAGLVKLRFFAGLTMPESAQALGVSLATAERYWTYAKAWLYAELSEPGVAKGPKKREGG